MAEARSPHRLAAINARARDEAAGMGKCRCGRRWESLTQCHCPTCHRQFGGITGFDAHRVTNGRGERMCLNPARAQRRDGAPMFEASDETFGTVWRRWSEQPAPQWKEKTRARR